jgi:hypothetical protein
MKQDAARMKRDAEEKKRLEELYQIRKRELLKEFIGNNWAKLIMTGVILWICLKTIMGF